MNTHLPESLLKSLRALDTCIAAEAIEHFDIRLRNEGFSTSDCIHCRFPNLPAMLGYAVTLRVRSANPPMEGGSYSDTPESWAVVEGYPSPQIVVIQDIDRKPGVGALVGELHAAVLQRMGCKGVITNGAVRDLSAVERRGLPMFSGSVSPSHAYTHIVDVGKPVEIAGLTIRPGDILLGDRHGIVRIPPDLAAQIPEEAARIFARKRELLAYCDSKDFSVEEFRERVKSYRH
jgi:4-hydroxy-4-methyl-2-oxoglutarate aldolase